MSFNRMLLLIAALLLFATLSCDGGGGTTPPPGGGGTTTNPEDLAPEVQVQIVDMRYRTSARTDEPFGQDPIPGIIAAARTSLDVALPRLNRQEIVTLLLQAAARGVQVRVVTERGYFDDPAYRPFYDQLTDAGAGGGNLTLRTDQDGFPRLMNARFLIVDNVRVVTGSYTWESADFERTIGDVVTILNTNVAAAFTSQFNQMFVEGNFGPNKRAETQTSFLFGGGSGLLDVHFGPTDRLREVMQIEIQQSNNVHVAVQQFKDVSLATTLLNWIAGNPNRQLHLTMNNIADIGDADDNAVYLAFANLINDPAEDMGRLILSGLAVDTPASTAYSPFLNYATMNHKLLFADHALSNGVPAVMTTTANFTDLGFSLNDEVMLILRGRPLVHKYLRGPFQQPGLPQRWSVDWNNSLPPAGLRVSQDMQEFDAMQLMFPYVQNVEGGSGTEVEGFRPFALVPTGVVFGEVTNFQRTIRIQNPEEQGDFEEVDIDLMFMIGGQTFFGHEFSGPDGVPYPGADPFVENEFVNPDHRYMLVVPAGEIEITTFVTVGGAVDSRFTPTTRTVTVGPGGIREQNLNINVSPSTGESGGAG